VTYIHLSSSYCKYARSKLPTCFILPETKYIFLSTLFPANCNWCSSSMFQNYTKQITELFIIIIIIGKTPLFWAIAFLRRFCQICLELGQPIFTSLDLATIIFLHGKVIKPCVRPPTWRTRSLYLCPPVTGWPSYTPQAPGSLFVAFYDSRGYGGGILSRLHTGLINLYRPKFQSLAFWRVHGIVMKSSRAGTHSQ
jgi:hypothetical protein